MDPSKTNGRIQILHVFPGAVSPHNARPRRGSSKPDRFRTRVELAGLTRLPQHRLCLRNSRWRRGHRRCRRSERWRCGNRLRTKRRRSGCVMPRWWRRWLRTTCEQQQDDRQCNLSDVSCFWTRMVSQFVHSCSLAIDALDAPKVDSRTRAGYAGSNADIKRERATESGPSLGVFVLTGCRDLRSATPPSCREESTANTTGNSRSGPEASSHRLPRRICFSHDQAGRLIIPGFRPDSLNAFLVIPVADDQPAFIRVRANGIA